MGKLRAATPELRSFSGAKKITMMSRKQLQQAFASVSFVSFFGSTIYGAIGAINAANQQLAAGTPKAGPSVKSQAQAQAKGYEMVLQI